MVLLSEEDGLVFRTSDHTPDVINQVLLERGWHEYNEEKDSKSEGSWNLWWRTQRFRKSEHDEIAPWQRLNHFPRTDAITRKDCLVRNLRRMRCVHGMPMFNFHPQAYILPNEYTKFVTDYSKERQKTDKKNIYWICKPVDLSRGRGIFVFHDLKDLSYDCPVVVQRYITNPFLISGYKFDIRIYVCVPSFQPLTIYMYQEGIVRFGTDKFDLNQLNNVFSHLTNTSINKYGPSYATDKERVGPGCKWTLSQLRSYLRQIDAVDELKLWFRICNIVTCTLATQAPSVPKCRNCFEVFGFDILIDDQLKPWLLEVNFSPALSMDCQADFIAKRSMINDLIDLLNFKESDREHGGETFRSCSPLSSARETPTSCRRLKTPRFSEATSKAAGRACTSAVRRTNSLCNKLIPVSKSCNVIPLSNDSTFADKQTKKDWTRRKSDTRFLRSKREQAKDKITKSPSKSLSLPQLYQSVQDGCSEPSSNFPRNFSSNSVSSSISSVDQANQAPNDSSEEKKMKNLTLEEDCEVDVNKKSDKNGDSMLSSIAEAQNGKTELKTLNPICNDSSFSPLKSLSPKIFRKKKSLNSAPESRQIKASKSAISPLKTNSGKPKLKTFGNYRSPYSIASTAVHKTSSSNPWPRTRVGDFILTFPLNDAMRKASGTNFDMKVIIKEQQKIIKAFQESHFSTPDPAFKVNGR